MIRLPEHVAVVLIEMSMRNGSKLAIFKDEIVERLSTQFGIEAPHGLVEESIQILEAIRGCKVLPSPLTGPYYQIDAHGASYYFGNFPSFSTDRGDEDYDAEHAYATAREIMHERLPVIATYYAADSRWFELVVAKLADMDLAREFYVDKDPSVEALGEDAIDVAHEPQIEEIQNALADLESEISESNEAGQIFGDDRQAAIAEVSALRRIFDASRLRAAAVLSQSKNTLGWIIEKSAGAAVGELAKRLLHLIIGLFS